MINFKITSDGVGSLAENASIERRLSVSGIYADGEDEEDSNHGDNKAGGYHFHASFASYLELKLFDYYLNYSLN